MTDIIEVDDEIIQPDIIEHHTQASGPMSGTIPNSDYRSNSNPMATGSTTQSEASRGTLDETIVTTIKRDVFDVHSRLRQVVYPHFPTRILAPSSDGQSDQTQPLPTDISAHCDLWAPLIFIIIYAVIVSHAKTLFSSLFVSCWFILLVMAVHLRLTKPHEAVSLISYISLSGYCLFPLVLHALFSQILLPLFFSPIHENLWAMRALTILKLSTLGLCLAWSLTAISLVTASRGFIQIYPLGLCLFGIAWLATIL